MRGAEVSTAQAAPTPSSKLLRVHIGHAPVARHLPALDGVQMVDRTELAAAETADFDQLLKRRLHVAGLVLAPTLQDRGVAVPPPWIPKAGMADRENRLLKGLELPALAAVCRHVHPLDPATPRPGEPGDLVEPRPRQLHFAGGEGDNRLRFHDEAELPSLAARKKVGVFRCLLAGHERLITDLEPPQPLDVRIALPARQ